MKLILLVISPLLAAPVLNRREAPFSFSFMSSSSKSTETKTKTAGEETVESEPIQESSSNWFGISDFGLGSALKVVSGSKPSKQALKKSIVSTILPFSSGVHDLREAKDDLKDALNHPDPKNPIPFRQVIDLRDGFDSFKDGAIETASKIMNPLSWFSGGKEGDEEALKVILDEEMKLKEREDKEKEKEMEKEKEKEKKSKKKALKVQKEEKKDEKKDDKKEEKKADKEKKKKDKKEQ